MAQMIDFFEEMEVEHNGLINESSSSKDLLDHITEKMDERMEGMVGRFQPG